MSQLRLIDQQQAMAMEMAEASHWSKLYLQDASLRFYSSNIAGAWAGAMPDIDILAMNRVIGLGISRPITSKDIDRIIHFYKRAGSRRFFIQLCPFQVQDKLSGLLASKGFYHYNNWAKLIRPVDIQLPEVQTALQIVEIGKEKADLFSQLVLFSFGWEGSQLARSIAARVGLPGFYHYLIKKENRAIGAGALFVENKIATMAFAATLPEYRGMGAQRLLLKTRIEKVRELGCNYIISETAEDLPGRPVTSYRNMLRMGFEQAYLRENWLYEI